MFQRSVSNILNPILPRHVVNNLECVINAVPRKCSSCRKWEGRNSCIDEYGTKIGTFPDIHIEEHGASQPKYLSMIGNAVHIDIIIISHTRDLHFHIHFSATIDLHFTYTLLLHIFRLAHWHIPALCIKLTVVKVRLKWQHADIHTAGDVCGGQLQNNMMCIP